MGWDDPFQSPFNPKYKRCQVVMAPGIGATGGEQKNSLPEEIPWEQKP